jgi:hypothetical protein
MRSFSLLEGTLETGAKNLELRCHRQTPQSADEGPTVGARYFTLRIIIVSHTTMSCTECMKELHCSCVA